MNSLQFKNDPTSRGGNDMGLVLHNVSPPRSLALQLRPLRLCVRSRPPTQPPLLPPGSIKTVGIQGEN